MPTRFLRRIFGRKDSEDPSVAVAPTEVATRHDEGERPELSPGSLLSLPGVGPALAQRLADAGYGSVSAIEQAEDSALLAIPGLGPGTLEKIRAHIRMGALAPAKRAPVALDRDAQPIRAINSRMRSERSASELIGLVKGIMADGTISDDEFRLLHHWFHANPDAADSWPGDTILAMLDDIVADGVVTPEEVSDLEVLLRKVVGGQGGILAAQNAPTALPLDDPPPPLTFTGQVYVFTGAFALGPRKACEEMVVQLGGRPERDVTMRTNVLVIGTLASRDWIHTSYGRKIEKAVEYRDRGVPITIVNEDYWAAALP